MHERDKCPLEAPSRRATLKLSQQELATGRDRAQGPVPLRVPESTNKVAFYAGLTSAAVRPASQSASGQSVEPRKVRKYG